MLTLTASENGWLDCSSLSTEAKHILQAPSALENSDSKGIFLSCDSFYGEGMKRLRDRGKSPTVCGWKSNTSDSKGKGCYAKDQQLFLHQKYPVRGHVKIVSHWKIPPCFSWQGNLWAMRMFTNVMFSKMSLLSFKGLIYFSCPFGFSKQEGSLQRQNFFFPSLFPQKIGVLHSQPGLALDASTSELL